MARREGADTTRTASRRRTASSPAPDATARVVYPPGLEAAWPLGAAPLVVGRNVEGAGRVDHATVSRAHLSLEWDATLGAHVAKDLGSHNGSKLDGVPLRAGERGVLADGSVVRFGDVLLVLEHGEPETLLSTVSADAVPGQSAAARRLRNAIARAAPDPSPVLLVGPTGAGKEFVAQEVHRLSRRQGRFVAVNCAALSPELVESALFGHVRGAFTGATAAQPGFFRSAEGGTIFLDELGELSTALQPKLLRAVQEREVQPVGGAAPIAVDTRVVAATNRDLAASVENGEFRRDLYARLSLWEIHVPSLAERRGDLLGWIDRLARRWLEERGKPSRPIAIDPEAAEILLLHPWPENLRGLDRLVHELLSRESKAPAGIPDLPAWITAVPAPKEGNEPPETSSAGSAPTREQFSEAHKALDGNVRALARHFGRDRRQIYRWIKAWGLARPARE